jgi:predicted O-methyltransferase YrrM
MLEKTQAMLARYKAGAYLPDDVVCFDDEEIEELGRVLAKLVYAPSKLRKRLQALGATLTRADFYSEIPTVAELEAYCSHEPQPRYDHVFRDAAFLEGFLRSLLPFAQEFCPPLQADDDRYAWGNTKFSFSDAMAYYCMVRRFQPRTIVEIGCGASTLIASLACERNGDGRIVAIEPYPAEFLHRIPRVEVIRSRIQDVATDKISELLAEGDFLFIDSTHTVKHGSDCLHVYLDILPQIARRVFVHAHDIFLPGSLPLHFMRDHQVYWNEQYLLYAYLLGNPRTRVLYGSVYHAEANPGLLLALMCDRYKPGGASLWFEQAGPV